MKVALKLLALSAVSLYAGSAFAQTCTSAAVAASVGTVSGNSCQSPSTLNNFCSNADAMNGAGVAVYSLTLGAANSGVTVQATSAVFHVYLAVQAPNASGCSSSFACIGPSSQATANNSTQTQTFASPAPAGTYYVVVGDTDVDSPGCGAFSLTVAGTLPVTLQDFSVQ